MPDLVEQLRRYGDAVEREALRAFPEPGLGRGHRDSRTWWLAAAVVLIAAVVTSSPVVLRDDGGERLDLVTDPIGGLFSSATETVLLFTDGLDGTWAVDLDAATVSRQVVEGERAGDQSFRLVRSGSEVVVGWGELYGVPLDGGSPHVVAEGDEVVPTAEPGEVWVLDHGDVAAPAPTVHRVTLDGRVTYPRVTLPDEAWPVLGLPGGLAVRTSGNRLAIWDASSQQVGPVLADGEALGISSSGTRLAWCTGTCVEPNVIELRVAGPPTPPHVSYPQAITFSPDGRHLAYVTGSRLLVRDVDTGRDTMVTGDLAGETFLQWGPAGNQLFAASFAGTGMVRLGRYAADSHSWETSSIDVPTTYALGFVALGEREARPFIADSLSNEAECAPPARFPSGRTGACGYSLRPRQADPTPTEGGAERPGASEEAELFGGLSVRLIVPNSVRTGGELHTTMRVENLSGSPVIDPGCRLSNTRHALIRADEPSGELWTVTMTDCGGAFTYEPGVVDEFAGPTFQASTKYGDPLPPGDYLAACEVDGQRLEYPVEVTAS